MLTYFKMLGLILAIPAIILFNIAVLVTDFNLLDKADRVGFTIVSLIVTAIACALVAGAECNKNKEG